MAQSARTEALDRSAGDRQQTAAALGIAVTVGVTYFLAARLGLALLSTPDGVAAFWPAAGLAAGAIVAFGPAVRAPVAIGAMAATVLANLFGGRSLPASLAFAACNAGEALLIGWLIERQHGSDFSLDSLPRVLGFFLAAGIATALSGLGGAAVHALFHTSEATAPQVWLHWFVAHALGAAAVAPLVIGVARSVRNPPRPSEVLEGTCILSVLACASLLGFAWPTEHWFTIMPSAWLLPLLVWPAARCPPAFAAASAFTVALIIIWSITFGVGRLGDPGVPLPDRLLAAQAALLAISACSLIVAALFAERRTHEVALSANNSRLRTQEEAFRRLLGSLPAAIYTTDTAGHITYCNQAAVDLWGKGPEPGNDRWFDLWRLHYPDGSSVPLDDRPTQIVLNEGRAVRGREALLERPDGTMVPIMPCPAPLLDERGTIIGVVNMQVDLTDRKRAQVALAERDAQLTLASKVARVGSYTLDYATGLMGLSPGCAALYGLPEGITEVSRNSCRANVHPEDLPGVDLQFAQAYRDRQREHVAQFRVVRPNDGQIRWIETRNIITYDDAGQPLRMIGIGIDLTERKQAEEHQSMLIAELDHRVKNVLATVSAVASRTQDASRSGADFATDLAGRIQSMAATHELLSGGRWRGVSLDDLVRRELAPYMSRDNTDLGGPDLMLRPEAAQALSMVLHELTTNAAKHGALSTEGGRVSVRWERTHASLRIEWREAGGPPVEPPERVGYGAEVIRDLIPYELDGAVDLSFAPGGVLCILTIPAAELSGEGRRKPAAKQSARSSEIPTGASPVS